MSDLTESTTVLNLKRKANFVETPLVENLATRSLHYLKAGYPVHFSGPAGTGKTTLAMHVAASLGRPVILIHGDDEMGGSDLIGGEMGYRSTRLVDNYIHSVVKTEENVSKIWMDQRLTTACKMGFTLIYDEFNRSRPEANNVLLGILEERLLELPSSRSGDGYLKVHPQFNAIFTSNPEEYAGVHKTQDALLDRMITIKMGHYDFETETAITATKSNLSQEDAAKIVALVRSFRVLGVTNFRPTIRACVMIGRICAVRNAKVSCLDPIFCEICRDVLCIDTIKITHNGESVGKDRLDELIQSCCPPGFSAMRVERCEEEEKEVAVTTNGRGHGHERTKKKSAHYQDHGGNN